MIMGQLCNNTDRGKTEVLRRRTAFPIVTLFNTNPTWNGIVSNAGTCNDRPVNNSVSLKHGAS